MPGWVSYKDPSLIMTHIRWLVAHIRRGFSWEIMGIVAVYYSNRSTPMRIDGHLLTYTWQPWMQSSSDQISFSLWLVVKANHNMARQIFRRDISNWIQPHALILFNYACFCLIFILFNFLCSDTLEINSLVNFYKHNYKPSDRLRALINDAKWRIFHNKKQYLT